jgi:3D (Asp-Asp-Asp) domain-containing protein
MFAQNDWAQALVIDPRQLDLLVAERAALHRSRSQLRVATGILCGMVVVLGSLAWVWGSRLDDLVDQVRDYRKNAAHANAALATLSRSHDGMIAATKEAPLVGTRSWGRRFVVTRYLARSSKYGKFNDGLTATMTKADPGNRIVAVDPKLIPYGSWVWVEGVGWFHAEDCGSAIKGFRLDLLTATMREAREFGRQERFVIVVPPGAAGGPITAARSAEDASDRG